MCPSCVRRSIVRGRRAVCVDILGSRRGRLRVKSGVAPRFLLLWQDDVGGAVGWQYVVSGNRKTKVNTALGQISGSKTPHSSCGSQAPTAPLSHPEPGNPRLIEPRTGHLPRAAPPGFSMNEGSTPYRSCHSLPRKKKSATHHLL